MASSVFPISNITHLIPQKKPFVMVNQLLAFSSNSVTSCFTIQENNLFIEQSYFNEAGMIENMAQTVALHTGYDYFLKGKPAPTGYIGSIKKVQILKLPKLKETIITKVNILHEFQGITMVSVQVFNTRQAEIASAEMKTVIAQ